jgi:hypothetical protein
MKHFYILLFAIVILPIKLKSQALENITGQESTIGTDRRQYSSSWILHPEVTGNDHAVILFRKSFDLEKVPDQFIIHISADNRYRLHVNGIFASKGPAKSDLFHWYYETLDLASLLKKGKNVLAVEVVNFGPKRTWSQFSTRTDLFVQGHTDAESIVNTVQGSWLTYHNTAYHPKIVEWITRKDIAGGLYVANPMDSLILEKYPWDWEKPEFDDGSWKPAAWSNNAGGRNSQYAGGINYSKGKLLVPRPIRLLKENKQRFTRFERYDSTDPPEAFLKGKQNLIIPPQTNSIFLIDQTYMTIGYPEMIISGGKGGEISVAYAETLFNKDKLSKGNRNDLKDKILIGIKDIYLPDGRHNRKIRPLSHRAFRVVQIEVETDKDTLIIHDFYNMYTAYPLALKAHFSSDDPDLDALMEPGWRSASICAQDILLSDAYYEQMQYVGDSKVHNLAILYLSGNDDLVRNCLQQIDWSRNTDGITLACYPNAFHLVIPFYSLVWIEMIHDYMMWSGDEEFISRFENGIDNVLGWYSRRFQENGLLGPLEWWNDVDWSPGFPNGTPPGIEKGNSALFSLEYAVALKKAAEIFEFLGKTERSEPLRHIAEKIILSVNDKCYDSDLELYAETPDLKSFSQHTNILAILAESITGEEARLLMNKILEDESLNQVALFFRYYLFEALRKTGMSDRFFNELGPWYEMLEMGLTTFTEVPLHWTFQRSECHPWSTSPNVHFFKTVCGISPIEPGYKSFEIKPEFGPLTKISATFPHPECKIIMDLERKVEKIVGTIEIKGESKGKLVWNDYYIVLVPGINRINL